MIFIIKSPGVESGPATPPWCYKMSTLPLILKFCPLLMPLGIVIDSFVVVFAVPVPAQVLQGLFIDSPEPLHLLQTI